MPQEEELTMNVEFTSSIVRIYATDGTIAGSGFLVAERRVVTCAHVVALGLDIPRDATEPPLTTIQIDFPLVAPGHTLAASVVLWQPEDDVAGLEFKADPPSGARPTNLAAPKELWGHPVRAFGFPGDYDSGVWASGILRGRTVAGWVQFEDVKSTGYFVETGFSGAPVWDEQLGGVIGMVTAAETRPEISAVFMIPSDILIQTWPSLTMEQRTTSRVEITRMNLARLREVLATRFNEEELRTLCFDLDIYYDDLPAMGKTGKSRELVKFVERRGRVPELVTTLTRLRPDISGLEALFSTATERVPDQPDTIPEPASLPSGSRMPIRRDPLFVGREDDLRALARALRVGEKVEIGDVVVAAVTGLGGVGKTRLASEFVHRYGQYFEGGVFWLNFADPDTVPAEIAVCGGTDYMNLRPDFDNLPLDEQVRLVLAAWQRSVPRLLVFDQCMEPELLQRWRPSSGACRVLVTSRRTQWDAWDVQALPLRVLSRAQSVAVLRRYRPDLPEDHPDLDAIAHELGDLPLALQLAGSYLARYQHTLTPAAYLAQLRDEALLEHPSLQALEAAISPTDHQLHVARTFALSYKQLDHTVVTDDLALALLARAAYFAPDEPIPRDLLLATLDLSDDDPDLAILEVEDGLARLGELGLLETEAKGALLLHPLLATFVRRATDDIQAQAAVEQAVLEKAKRLHGADSPAPLLALQPHLRAVTDAACSRDDERAADLCDELAYHLDIIGEYSEARSYYERALAMREVTLGENHPAIANSLNNLGGLLRAQGDYTGARSYLERALTINEAMLGETHLDTANSLTNIGELLSELGDHAAARPYFERALAIKEAVLEENDPAIAYSLNNLGDLLYAIGDYVGARPYFERALAVNEVTLGSSHPSTANVLNNLGYLLYAQEDYAGARPYLERALAIREKVLGRNHPDTAQSLRNLGNLLRPLGELEDAVDYYERALAISQTIGDRHSEGDDYNNLGKALRALGRVEEAIKCYDHVLSISREVDDHRMEEQVLDSLGTAYRILGNPERAMDYHQRALAIARQNKELSRVAEILVSMGSLARDNEQFAQAKQLWMESLEIYQQLGHPLVSNVLSLLDELESVQGGLFSLAESAQRFFQAAGFELIPREEETAFLCRPGDRALRRELPALIAVEIVSGCSLDGEKVRTLCQSAAQVLDDKPVVFVVIDRTPTDSGWLQIGTMRAENVQVIPIDDTVLLAGQEHGRQRRVLEKHLRRFLGPERDLYNVRDPVADRLNFFGREALATKLLELLTEGRPVALLGLRKMGKSSLLKYMRDNLPFPTALVDLQAGVELGGLYSRVFASWNRSMRVKVEGLDWAPPDLAGTPDFSSIFTEATRQLLTFLEEHGVPPRLCLLVDETEWIVPHNGQGLERYLAFARALRGLAQEEEGRFSLLMAGVHPAFNRVNRLAGQQNPFYQFFREIYLPSLERDDCIQMIRNIGRQMGLVYSDEAVAFVADVSGGHPFLARQLCSMAFQQLGRHGDVPLSHLQEVAGRFIREPGTSELVDENGLWGEISSPDLWPQSQVVENQAVLKSLAQTEPQPESELVRHARDRRACERSLDELERRAVLNELERRLFNIRLRLFRNWIRRYQLGEE
jgi:tetratricopeptide (TPR) repeat protein